MLETYIASFYLVYQARPFLSHCRKFGERKAREGLADVISIHDKLTNQIVQNEFSL